MVKNLGTAEKQRMKNVVDAAVKIASDPIGFSREQVTAQVNTKYLFNLFEKVE